MEITPKIKFKNNKDFMNKKNIMFATIKETVNEIIEDSDSETIYFMGFTPVYKSQLEYTLYIELNKLNNNQYQIWCKNITYNIIFSIESSINALIHINKIDKFTMEEIGEFIYKNIVWQLGDGTNNEAILDDIHNN